MTRSATGYGVGCYPEYFPDMVLFVVLALVVVVRVLLPALRRMQDIAAEVDVSPVELTPAPVGRRLGALVIDLLLGAASAVGFGILVANLMTGFFNSLSSTMNPDATKESTIDLGGFLWVLILVAIVWGISSLLLWEQGTSPGKKMLGLYVVDSRTGADLGFGRMYKRETYKGIGVPLFGIPLVIGLIMIIANRNRMSYWDMMAGTIVVKRN